MPLGRNQQGRKVTFISMQGPESLTEYAPDHQRDKNQFHPLGGEESEAYKTS